MTEDNGGPACPDLSGKVVVVTGASKRLGRCYAMSLARAGARVVALARGIGDDPERPGTLAEVEATGRRRGWNVTAIRCDLSDEADIDRAVERIVGELGGIDALVNNAVTEVDRIDHLSISREVWDAHFDVNVRAPYLLMARSVPHMVARGGGAIVNITSLAAGKTGRGGGAHKGLLQYGLSKAALNRLTTWFAAEYEDANIAVNAISPGDVSVYLRVVNGIGAEVPDRDVVAGEQLHEDFWGRPVVWLCGARPADVTGQILHTYSFGQDWGPRYETEPDWPPAIRKILGRDNLKAR